MTVLMSVRGSGDKRTILNYDSELFKNEDECNHMAEVLEKYIYDVHKEDPNFRYCFIRDDDDSLRVIVNMEFDFF